MGWLKGKKSYAIGFLLILAGGLRQQGFIDETTFRLLEGVLLGGGIMALRAGISKAGNGK